MDVSSSCAFWISRVLEVVLFLNGSNSCRYDVKRRDSVATREESRRREVFRSISCSKTQKFGFLTIRKRHKTVSLRE